MTQAAVLNRRIFEQRARWAALAASPADRQRLELLADMVPADVHSVLDVGCGTGGWLALLAPRCRVLGVEPSSTARTLAPVPVIDGNATEPLPLADRSYDLVGCHEVLEHLPRTQREAAAGQLARLTRRYLLMSVPWRESPILATCRCGHCGRTYHAHGHVGRFTSVRSLTRWFRGFALRRHCLHGDSHGYRLEPLGNLPHRWLGLWRGEPQGHCPQCDSPAGAPNVRRRRWFDRWLEALDWRLLRPQPRWLTVLLERM